MSELKIIFAVGAGGAIGAIARYGVARATIHAFGAGFPIGTLLVNVIGSFAMGALTHWFLSRGDDFILRSFLLIGCLGAFTTFSTFSLDAVTLFRDRTISIAAIYVLLSIALSIGGFVIGFSMFRSGS